MGVNDLVSRFIDPYDRPARLYPALLVLLPIPVLLVCLYGTSNLLWSSLLSILGFCGVAYALGRAARDAGKRLEPKLYKKWGGAPTTQLLRHRHSRYDPHTKVRFHGVLAAGIKQPFPSAEDEQAAPDKADDLYRAGTTWLIAQTRDAKVHALVFKENVAFGFQRNALGMRPFGLCVAFVCIVWALLHAQVLVPHPPFLVVTAFNDLQPAVLVTLAISALLIILWLAVFTAGSVERTGFAYGERLVESCDKLAKKPATKRATAPKTEKP